MRRYQLSTEHPVARLLESYKLPPGHTERVHARKAVDREYARSREIEARHRRPLRKKFGGNYSLRQAQQIARFITSEFGCYRQITVRLTDKPYAFCAGRSVYLHRTSGIMVIAHEVAHAIVNAEGLSGRHNGDFLWVLEMVLEMLGSKRVVAL